jgi:2'-5' RNA ligase
MVVEKIEKLIEEAARFPNGLYVSATLDPTGIEKIWRYLKQIGIQTMPINKAHVTIIYSPRPPIGDFKIKDIHGYVKPKAVRIFGKGTRQEPYALVIELDSPELERLRREYMQKYRLTSTYREYVPHLTVTYDLGRVLPGINKLKDKQKKTIENVFSKIIPELPRQIKILNQTAEDLDD